MAIKFESVKAGDTLYSVSSGRAGNTTLRRVDVREVKVISVDYEKFTAQCSSNNNPVRTYFRKQIERLRRTMPKAKV